MPFIGGGTGPFDVYPNWLRGLTFTVTRRPIFDTILQRAPNAFETTIGQYANPIWHWVLTYDYLKDSEIQLDKSYTDLETLLGFFLNHAGRGNWFYFQDPDNHTIGPTYNNSQIRLALRLPYNGHAGTGVNHALCSPTNYAACNAIEFNSMADAATYATAHSETLWEVFNELEGYELIANPSTSEMDLVLDTVSGIRYTPILRDIGGFYQEIDAIVPGTLNVYANNVLQVRGTNYEVHAPNFAITGQSFGGVFLKWLTTPTQPINVECEFYHLVRFESDDQDFEKFMHRLWTIGGHGKHGKGYVELTRVRPLDVGELLT